ncbi:WD40-repeat-containing domain protein [Endogone sp. FLAS-F59071]|nr:WD40-repeat-containing domain protein [Endogone sp. FLAS-F59071]|eukprot:RUS21473.1 WD40-repeat-containing domain protein [Endogone sp. FLAS-F59071]
MPPTPTLLASAARNVKIWDIQPTQNSATETTAAIPVASFQPSSEASLAKDISCLKWSHDNNALAVTSINGTLSVHDARGKSLQTVPPPDGDLVCLLKHTANTSPSANSNHPTINTRAVIGPRQTLRRHLRLPLTSASLWWLHQRNPHLGPQGFKGHTGTISSISVNIDESLIASASLTGDILIHPKGQKHQSYSTLIVPTEKPITSLEFSTFRRDLVVAAGEDGCVRMWDVQASLSPVYTFDAAHYGSVRGGIAFSPYNRYLMASAGLDKRIALYDVDKRVIVKSLQTDEPLTALAFKSDGVTIAVGSANGRIFVYDLRSSNSPTCRVNAHDVSAVTCLRFQEKFKIATSNPPRRTTNAPSNAIGGPDSKSRSAAAPALASSNGTAPAPRPSAAEFIRMQRKGGREVASTADNKPASKEKEHVVEKEKEKEKEIEAREKQGRATEQEKDKQPNYIPNYMDLFSPIKDVGSGGEAAKGAMAGADGEASMMSMATIPDVLRNGPMASISRGLHQRSGSTGSLGGESAAVSAARAAAATKRRSLAAAVEFEQVMEKYSPTNPTISTTTTVPLVAIYPSLTGVAVDSPSAASPPLSPTQRFTLRPSTSSGLSASLPDSRHGSVENDINPAATAEYKSKPPLPPMFASVTMNAAIKASGAAANGVLLKRSTSQLFPSTGSGLSITTAAAAASRDGVSRERPRSMHSLGPPELVPSLAAVDGLKDKIAKGLEVEKEQEKESMKRVGFMEEGMGKGREGAAKSEIDGMGVEREFERGYVEREKELIPTPNSRFNPPTKPPTSAADLFANLGSTTNSSSYAMSRPSKMPVHPDDENEPPLGDTSTEPIHQRVLENVMEDCLAEFRVGLHEDIVNMHLELLRQFHIQRVDDFDFDFIVFIKKFIQC